MGVRRSEIEFLKPYVTAMVVGSPVLFWHRGYWRPARVRTGGIISIYFGLSVQLLGKCTLRQKGAKSWLSEPPPGLCIQITPGVGL